MNPYSNLNNGHYGTYNTGEVQEGIATRKGMSWICDDDTLALIRQYSLQNSLEYNGQGKPGSVMGRIMAERSELRQYGSDISKIINDEVQKANELASSEGLDKIRAILENEAPQLLEKRKTERKEGLPELDCASEGKVVLRFAPTQMDLCHLVTGEV